MVVVAGQQQRQSSHHTMDSSGVIIEEQKLMTEAKYRVYMSNIDKALKNFEYSSEWADLISALGKLNKVSSLSVVN